MSNGTYQGYLGPIPDLKEVHGTYDVRPGSPNVPPKTTGKGPSDGVLGFANDVKPGELTESPLVEGGLGGAWENPPTDPQRGRATRQSNWSKSPTRQGDGAIIDAGYPSGGEHRV